MLPALEVQEICDYICDFLHESPADLRACSLTWPLFTSSAQYHLFHTIDLATTTPGQTLDPTTRTIRLCAILAESPYLIRFIRHLNVSLKQDVLAPLAQVHLTHVEAIVLVGDDGYLSNPPISLAARLIEIFSVRRLRLVSMTFQKIDGLCTLFRHQRTTPFHQIVLDNVHVFDLASTGPIAEGVGSPQHVGMKVFEIFEDRMRDPSWLVHPLCPFDFSALSKSSIWCGTPPGIITLMRSARSSLHTLRIDAREVTKEFRIADFDALRRLDIFCGLGGATPALNLLASTGSAHLPLEYLTTRIAVLSTLDNESIRRLDATIAGLNAPHLRGVHFLVSKAGVSWSGLSTAEFVGMMEGMPTLFPQLTARGCLSLSYITDGIQTDL
ncbi:hypothetical protein MVEN_01172600 [Mycena venus]|uniref:Uncharacterized protein n=1 Tax=Mycena venus TaxID=2733690 RepID=A0A8H6Y128_9AGAR|nr:hypothetical protein MVEN_01172600 [Mycena venus]